MVRSRPVHNRRTSRIDLVDQREVVVPLAILDLIHSNGRYPFKGAMLKTPLHHPFNRVVYLLPGGVECRRHFPPG